VIAIQKKPLSNEQRVLERIANDLKDHVVTVRHMDGLYRHWRCQKPGEWFMGFDVVTWPGSLCYTGDMGEYLFQRTADMVEFMSPGPKECSYLASKCVAGKDTIKEWREDRFNEILKDRIEESKENGGTFCVMRQGSWRNESVKAAVVEIRRAYREYSHRFDAEKAMYESGLWDGADMPSCEVYTFSFLWCLHALKWFCERVDEARVRYEG